jgi:ATPase family associated with various cellular activities (AAA)
MTVPIDELPVGKSEYDRADFWIGRREKLDDVLQKPARTLVRLVKHTLKRSAENGTFTVPLFIDEKEGEDGAYSRGSVLVHAVTCSAVQELYDDQRRYAWLDSVVEDLEGLHEAIPKAFIHHPALRSDDLLEKIDVLHDPAFGAMNVLTAAEVFWVLIRAGESYAHGELGFLALFSLLWALKRPWRDGRRFVAGAALGTWRPSVAVTARALFPLLRLIRIIRRRAGHYRDMAEECKKLYENEQGITEHQRWKFASSLERLSIMLYRLADISIKPESVRDIAEAIMRLADPIAPGTATASIAVQGRQQLRSLFVELGRQNEFILAGAEKATDTTHPALIGMLKDHCEGLRKKCRLLPDWGSQIAGAEEAGDVCRKALKELQRAVSKSKNLPSENTFSHEILMSTLAAFADINDAVAGILENAIADNAEWCRQRVTTEVAYASSENDSEFDVAELLSGVLIAQRTEKISRAAIEDAVSKSLRAARSDGSWRSDQPIYLEKHFVGVWPGTADLLFLLASAAHHNQDFVHAAHVADRHLLRYVGLLEAQRAKRRPQWWRPIEGAWGFPSESREPYIDLWASATAVRALMRIREVIEDRLWEICEGRFTIRRPRTTLADLDPVDLGARHERRLQTRLMRTAAKTLRHEANAEYGYVLHGPPGSSKTALADAIGQAMWRRTEKRLVRITPADFTRGGEDGVDLEARFIFRLLAHVRGVTIFFDEIDDLLRKRKVDADLSFIRLVIPGMLNRLQDLRDAAPRQEICFLLATNYVDQIEPALTRRGRIDATIPVPYPDAWSRQSILEKIAEKAPHWHLSDALKDEIVSKTAFWPWSTYQKLCKHLMNAAVDDIDELIDEYSADFESADYYYRNAARWKAASPLTTEFAHVSFAVSKRQRECRASVVELEKYLGTCEGVDLKELKLSARFEREWQGTGRE